MAREIEVRSVKLPKRVRSRRARRMAVTPARCGRARRAQPPRMRPAKSPSATCCRSVASGLNTSLGSFANSGSKSRFRVAMNSGSAAASPSSACRSATPSARAAISAGSRGGAVCTSIFSIQKWLASAYMACACTFWRSARGWFDQLAVNGGLARRVAHGRRPGDRRRWSRGPQRRVPTRAMASSMVLVPERSTRAVCQRRTSTWNRSGGWMTPCATVTSRAPRGPGSLICRPCRLPLKAM